jgi:hypothetical protein
MLATYIAKRRDQPVVISLDEIDASGVVRTERRLHSAESTRV